MQAFRQYELVYVGDADGALALCDQGRMRAATRLSGLGLGLGLDTLQSALACAARGRSVDLQSTVAAASTAWERAMADATEVLGAQAGQHRVTR